MRETVFEEESFKLIAERRWGFREGESQRPRKQHEQRSQAWNEHCAFEKMEEIQSSTI